MVARIIPREAGDEPGSVPEVGDIAFAAQLLSRSPSGRARAVGNALALVLRGVPAERALGLAGTDSGRSPLVGWRIAQRNRLIMALADFWRGESPSVVAAAIVAEESAYQRRQAAADRFLDEMPASYAGRPRALLFEMAKLRLEMPKAETIRKILSGGAA